jgi:hypothetical protein
VPESKPLKIPLFPLASGRTEVDERLGISFQKLAQHVPFRHVPHRHDFYHLIWIESGRGMFMRDGRSYPAEAGTLIFVPPGQVHTWKWEQPLQGYVLSFEPVLLFGQPDGISRLLHELTRLSTEAGVRRQAEGSVRDFVRERFEDLGREFCGREEFHDEMLRAQITALLIFLHRLYIGGAPNEPQEHFASLTSRFLSLEPLRVIARPIGDRSGQSKKHSESSGGKLFRKWLNPCTSTVGALRVVSGRESRR